MFQIGTVLDGTYQIMEQIGQGGAGMIYKAYHLRLQKYVVIKLIKENCGDQINVRGEADILKQLHHSFLPQIYDFMQYGTEVYTVMEFIQGYDLEFYMRQGYVFSEEQLTFWLRQLAEVLEYLHGRKPPIIHSDIKPANIMITSEGNVCLIDFNIALSNEEELIGFSPHYSSPEQYMLAMNKMAGRGNGGYVMDARSDIYSLGATFYYLMTGCPPNLTVGENVPLGMYSLPYSEGFVSIIDKMMHPEPEKRYASASRLLHALSHVEEQVHHYQNALKVRRIALGAYVFLTVIFALFVAKGLTQMRQERFVRDYDSVRDAYEMGRTEDAKRRGIDLLNSDSYRSLWKQHTEEQGNVWFVLGIISLEEGDYQSAADYMRSALLCSPNQTEYYKYYASALAAAGDFAGAEDVLGDATARGCTDSDMDYIAGQIAWRQGNYESAYNLFVRANIVRTEDRRWELRQLGKFYYEYAATQTGERRTELLGKAAEVFGFLTRVSYPIFQDYYNYALACEAVEDYDAGIRTLQELGGVYDSDYRVFAHLAVMTYEKELKEGRPYDFNAVKEFCRRAEELAGAQGGANDPCMAAVREIQERIN